MSLNDLEDYAQQRLEYEEMVMCERAEWVMRRINETLSREEESQLFKDIEEFGWDCDDVLEVMEELGIGYADCAAWAGDFDAFRDEYDWGDSYDSVDELEECDAGDPYDCEYDY